MAETGALEGVRVCVRVRPPTEKEVLHNSGLAITTPSDGQTVVIEGKDHTVKCRFDEVFPESASQADVFEQVKPAIAQVAQGYNACILAYGQTGSGKTHTMLGPDGGRIPLTADLGPNGTWGVIPRAVAYLHEKLLSLSSSSGATFSLHCSYMQIYNEKLHDLLQEQGFRDNLEIHEMTKGRNKGEIYVSGLAEFRVKDVEDVLELIQQGSRNRAIRATECNEVSSRSHAILQLLVEVESYGSNGQRTVRRAKLSLVDLAGSEKINKASADPMTQRHLKELTSINRSLSALGNVIAALTERRRTHIPYRDSKLTRLMQDSLGGNCRTVVIACLSPGRGHAEESISTTQFADRARSVLVRVKANEVVDDKVLLARAQAEIARLKLLLKNKGLGGGGEDSTAAADREVAALMAENAALRAEVKRLKVQVGERERVQRGGQSQRPTAEGGMGGVFRKIFARSGMPSHQQQQQPEGEEDERPPAAESEVEEGARQQEQQVDEEEEYHEDFNAADEEEEEETAGAAPPPEQQEQEEEYHQPPRPRRERRRATWGGESSTTTTPTLATQQQQQPRRLTPLSTPPAGMQRRRRSRTGRVQSFDESAAEYGEVSSTLRREERHLAQIREQRKRLEQQLALLQGRKAAAATAAGVSADLGHGPPAQGRRRRAASLTGLTTTSSSVTQRPATSDSTQGSNRRQRTNSDRAARKAESMTMAYSSGRPPANPTATQRSPQRPSHHHRDDSSGSHRHAVAMAEEPPSPPRIRNSIADLGLRLRIYSFRYDDWSECTVIGYDRVRRMHYCRYRHEKQWHTLGTKKVEVLGFGDPAADDDDEGDGHGHDVYADDAPAMVQPPAAPAVADHLAESATAAASSSSLRAPPPALSTSQASSSDPHRLFAYYDDDYYDDDWGGADKPQQPAKAAAGQHIHMTKIVSPAASESGSSRGSNHDPSFAGQGRAAAAAVRR